MHRRDFCKLLAIAAASKAVPSSGQAAPDSQPGVPSGFNQHTQDYAQFCALPPEKRVFYRVSDGKIVEQIRKKAADVGANAIIVNDFKESGATAKVIGATLGANSADTKVSALAIYMPAEAGRVRLKCGK